MEKKGLGAVTIETLEKGQRASAISQKKLLRNGTPVEQGPRQKSGG